MSDGLSHDSEPDSGGVSVPSTASPPSSAPVKDRPSRDTRFLRRWLIAQTVLLVLILGLLGAGMYVAWRTIDIDWSSDTASTDAPGAGQRVADVVWDAYPDSLESVRVETVTVESQPPDSFEAGSAGTYYAVTYRLKGADVPVTGVVSGPGDLVDFGLLPTQSSLSGQLSDAELLALMNAWVRASNRPLGAVTPYADAVVSDTGAEPDPSATMKVKGTRYPVEDLWIVSEGLSVPGDGRLTLEVTMGRRDVVFHLDPHSGSWSVVGTQLCEDYYPF